jgi:hypothetical protein
MPKWTLAFSCLLAVASGFGVALQQHRPLLPAQRRPYAPVSVVRMQAELAAVPDEPSPPQPVGLKARVASMLPPKKEMQKLVRRRTTRLTIHRVSASARAAPLLTVTPRQVPLASMFFCILFSYTILRDTKDVLVRASTHPAPTLDRSCDAETSEPVDQSTPCNPYAAQPAYPALKPILRCQPELRCQPDLHPKPLLHCQPDLRCQPSRPILHCQPILHSYTPDATPPCMPPQHRNPIRRSEIKCRQIHPAETPHAQLARPP